MVYLLYVIGNLIGISYITLFNGLLAELLDSFLPIPQVIT